MQTAHCGASRRLSAARRFRVVCGGTKWPKFALWRQHWPCCRPHDEWESCRDTPRQLTRAWAIFGERNLGCSCNESTSDQRDVRLQQAEPRARVSPASLRPAEVPILLSVGLVSFGGGQGWLGGACGVDGGFCGSTSNRSTHRTTRPARAAVAEGGRNWPRGRGGLF